MIGGCAASKPYSPQTYIVRPQDTLYSIAWRHNLDYRDLAKWNGIGSEYRLSIGQVLVLSPRASSGAAAGARAAKVEPRSPPPRSELAAASVPPASSSRETPRVGRPTPLPDAPTGGGGAMSGNGATPGNGAAPGSGAARAGAAKAVSGIRPGAGPTMPPETAAGAANSSAKSGSVAPPAIGGHLKWVWPTDRQTAPRPVPGGGILLLGRLGQDVRAASTGRVVYTGSGLRGYGNLIIIKHGDSLLSSYAHNREMLVHEGQDVVAGQTIAHMGTGAHQTSALYFEIRVNGKPTDPLRYLPAAQ